MTTIVNPTGDFEYRAEVRGAPKLADHKSTILPLRVALRWIRDPGKDWVFFRATVVGARVKKDGTLGTATNTKLFTPHNLTEAPTWLLQLIGEQEPRS